MIASCPVATCFYFKFEAAEILEPMVFFRLDSAALIIYEHNGALFF